ncbi:coiled-coil domain-containing protein 97 [Dermatophagoides pteronyssinus]|uniref:Coiled-coil domain-containing protein 97-like n=2 Tax=Dermatophagoides pteronyssinus TaxID=6956 RepID=A0A6P6XWG8_DERPT|nr:coiled-coil domain-containing protein 97-like [Dermatophagoides pteronyssinus]KAH9422100.1 Coiled-coil domain-containing protein 97 [Dermatophagoides pteronyssinus]
MTIMNEDNKSSNNFEEIKNKIIETISNEKNAFFIHQQRDDPDLSLNEKRIIVENLLESNRFLFLQRYGQYLDMKALTYFQSNDTCEEIQIQLGILKTKIQSKNKMLRNRRYQALQDLLKGTYFSHSEMQSRNPYLFEQMIGRYMNEQERKELQNSNYQQNYDRIGFSSYLFETIRQAYLGNQIVHTKEQSQFFDDDSSNDDNSEEIDDEKKDSLRKEFLKIMIENFLNGKDGEYFDYEKVDNNDDYDLSREFEHDQQDRYFEE